VASLRSEVISTAPARRADNPYVNTLGWRMDYQALWGVHPWAQVSYNQPLLRI
jgi:uncharacterized protein YhjY with autotransporter beta-barrel domain